MLKKLFFLGRFNKPFLAVPFAITIPFLSLEHLPNMKDLFCVFFASLLGFYAGNVFNAVVDVEIDQENPRTQDRVMASGQITTKEAIAVMIVSFLFLVAFTSLIDICYVFLLPIPIGISLFYSISKRFTWLCHFFLATTNAAVPVAAWFVFRSFYEWEWILAGAIVFFWTVGFELIYSSQDVLYDQKSKMHSIPLRFGVTASYRISFAAHIFMLVLLFVFSARLHVGIVFFVGSILGSVIIVYEHIRVYQNSTKMIEKILDVNQVFSCLLMIASVLDFYCR